MACETTFLNVSFFKKLSYIYTVILGMVVQSKVNHRFRSSLQLSDRDSWELVSYHILTWAVCILSLANLQWKCFQSKKTETMININPGLVFTNFQTTGPWPTVQYQGNYSFVVWYLGWLQASHLQDNEVQLSKAKSYHLQLLMEFTFSCKCLQHSGAKKGWLYSQTCLNTLKVASTTVLAKQATFTRDFENFKGKSLTSSRTMKWLTTKCHRSTC